MIVKQKTQPPRTFPSYTIDVYVSEDGREFGTKTECEDYEKSLKFRNIEKTFKTKSVRLSYGNILDESFESWSLIENREQLEYAKEQCGYNQKYDRIELNENTTPVMELKIGDWYAYRYEDGGDYRGRYYIYTLEFVLDKFRQFIEEME